MSNEIEKMVGDAQIKALNLIGEAVRLHKRGVLLTIAYDRLEEYAEKYAQDYIEKMLSGHYSGIDQYAKIKQTYVDEFLQQCKSEIEGSEVQGRLASEKDIRLFNLAKDDHKAREASPLSAYGISVLAALRAAQAENKPLSEACNHIDLIEPVAKKYQEYYTNTNQSKEVIWPPVQNPF
ncbi:hypothetical protein ccbrp13_25640 [Ktedonobacteria bacterium brp13]|nr:hypothetical protein ccbrp13_25640 [Ktedonobacteria bacterium brp13]